MKVIILGSSVVGVTSAYYLARAGHEMQVLDCQSAAGMETSFANAGQVSPGYSAPWAAPGIPLKALRWLLMRHRPLVLWPLLDRSLYGWLAQMLANCTEDAYGRNKGRMVRLAEYSRDALRDLRVETGITYDDRQRGTLQLFRTPKQLDHVEDDTAVLDQYGMWSGPAASRLVPDGVSPGVPRIGGAYEAMRGSMYCFNTTMSVNGAGHSTIR